MKKTENTWLSAGKFICMVYSVVLLPVGLHPGQGRYSTLRLRNTLHCLQPEKVKIGYDLPHDSGFVFYLPVAFTKDRLTDA